MWIKQWSMNVSVLVAMLALCACGDDRPVNVAGDYALNLTNDANTCDLPGLNDGGSSTIDFTIEQDGNAVTGTVTSAGIFGPGAVLRSLLGSSDFEGRVDEDSILMEIVGDRAFMDGNCAYTLNARFSAIANGDFIQGKVEYTRVDNGNPDCMALANCVTTQRFNGSRPPQ